MFFTYETELPANIGYELFGSTHIIIMLICTILVAGLAICFKRSDPRLRGSLLKITGIVPVILIVLRTVYVIYCKESLIYELPLHLCSLAGIICFIHCIGILPGFFSQVLYSLCLPGALLAIIFPNGNNYPAFHFITFESYLFHLLIIAYVIMNLIDKRISPSIRDSYKSILFLIFTVPPVYLVNTCLGTNYMFLMRPSMGSPLTGVYHSLGYAGYLIIFAVITIAEVIMIDLIGSRLNPAKHP